MNIEEKYESDACYPEKYVAKIVNNSKKKVDLRHLSFLIRIIILNGQLKLQKRND